MLLESVKELFKDKTTSSVKGKRKLSLSSSKRVWNVKEKQVNIRDALGKMKAEGMASGSEKLSGDKRVEKGSVKLADNLVGRRGKKESVATKGCDHLNIVEEIKEIKEKQAARDMKLDEILGILRQKTACVEAGSASGKGSLMGGNEEVKIQVAGPSGAGNTYGGVKCGDDLELSFDSGGPSFDLLTQMPKVDAIGDDMPNDKTGNVSVAEACDYAKQGKCLEIPYIETQYDPHDLELIDRETEMMLISLQNARSVKC
ncbi:unnamed protein product [Cuscuta campestris]|uniref:Uncharacterized protein n=1 Tax=Cuscuta campestris TaxID=132261 RepID=A0A484KE24_9ASTE|nr:unnamed protein product [Cuscuta campestris]